MKPPEKPEKDCDDFAAGELDQLLAEGEQSINQEGTLDGEEAFLERRVRRQARDQQAS